MSEKMDYEVEVKNTFLNFFIEEDRSPCTKTWSLGDLRPNPRSSRDREGKSTPAGDVNPVPPSLAKHPLKCKPCVYFASSTGCDWSLCSFCHLNHTGSGRRPRKQIRDAYKEGMVNAYGKP
ncbi:unnamed protein product [Durusdinium trenchii]|uniref:C3H1-type domain-containing protein n=1 Tax=Durusdinium trenchii TaxID=1381693 RepID=A0ABP0RRB7_9DINO